MYYVLLFLCNSGYTKASQCDVICTLPVLFLKHLRGNIHKSHLTFRGPCIVIYSYNKSQRDAVFLNIFGIELYMFRTVFLSVIRSLVLYTQQYVYVVQVMLTAC